MSLTPIKSSPAVQWESVQKLKERIQVQIFSDPCSPEVLIKNLAAIEGTVDVYCWYEGPQGLPQVGANFMKESILEPLYNLKPDAKLYLYSLRAWDFEKTVSAMPTSTPLGEAINRINKTAIECLYSYSFFQYCSKIKKESTLYRFINEELPKKKWLLSFSEDQTKKKKSVSTLFDGQSSLFDCIKTYDVAIAYAPMQYAEGFYLIQECVRRRLLKGQKKIQIAFALPNDESTYYADYPKDIAQMLQAEFGTALSDVEISISFRFFEYGDSAISRPYIDKRRKAPKVKPQQVSSYFNYLTPPAASPSTGFLRDVIHNLNGWY